MYKSILKIVNTALLPFLFSRLMMQLYKLQQYSDDIQECDGKMTHDELADKIGEKYREMPRYMIFIILIIVVILVQFLQLLYKINEWHRVDMNYLSFIAIMALCMTIALPIFYIVGYFYEVSFIGDYLIRKYNDGFITQYVSHYPVMDALSALFIIGNIIYMYIFNKMYYIQIEKV